MKKIGFLAVVILAYACAQVVSPTGGPRDVTPPKIAESNPLNYSNNFSGNEITLVFDEYVKVSQTQREVLISPPLKKEPKFILKNKKLRISWEEELLPNTTYSFFWGNAIADLNENNPLDSNRFIFSTGEYLDSLTLSGKVKNAFDLKVAENVWIMLYNSTEDSLLSKQKPTYIAKADKEGFFTLDFLKEGTYNIFALIDQNNNYLYDQPNEEIAFLLNPITLGDTTQVQLYLFKEETAKQFHKKTITKNKNQLKSTFNLAVKNPSFQVLGDTSNDTAFYMDYSIESDSVLLWPKIQLPDTFELIVFEDTLALDTVEIVLSSIKAKKADSLLALTLTKQGTWPYFENLSLLTNEPLTSFDTSKFVLLEDSLPIQCLWEISGMALREIECKHTLKQGANYQLIFYPQALQSVYGTTNDTIQKTFTVSKAEDYASILLQIKESSNTALIVQLLKENESIVEEMSISSRNVKVIFKNISPGNYKLKLIYDTNNNGKWDSGKYGTKTLPEKVIYYEKPLSVKPKFDMEIEWEILD